MEQELYSHLAKIKKSKAMSDLFKAPTTLELFFLGDLAKYTEDDLLLAYENFLKSSLELHELPLFSKRMIRLREIVEGGEVLHPEFQSLLRRRLDYLFSDMMNLFFEQQGEKASDQIAQEILSACKVAIEEEISQLKGLSRKSRRVSAH